MTVKHFKALSFVETQDLAHKVCGVIGHGTTGVRVELILEVIYWKTLNGNIRPQKVDRFGIAQLSSEAVRSVRENRCRNEKLIDAINKLSRVFYVDLIDTKPEELELSPMLSICFLALSTVNIIEDIPLSRKGRARYAVKYSKTSGNDTEERVYLEHCSIMDEEAAHEGKAK